MPRNQYLYLIAAQARVSLDAFHNSQLDLGIVKLHFEIGAKNIEVKKNINKAPYVVLNSAAEEVIRKHSPCEYYNVHVSIAHEKEYAVAFAVVESV